mmetsp:Transcript_3282/g.6871  ORF Transcript_3282/g.6871 Transcript_3282/m.6871 type:complete len:112 (+) Transcript_3282:100-435(+)
MAFVWNTIRRMTKWTFKPVPFVIGSGLGVWMAKEQLDLLRAREQKIMQALSGSSAPAPIVARPRYQVYEDVKDKLMNGAKSPAADLAASWNGNVAAVRDYIGSIYSGKKGE